MRIGIDVDGVLANFQIGYADALISASGRDIFPYHPFNDPKCWYWATDEVGYTKEEDEAAWAIIRSSNRFWQTLPRYDDAKQHLELLTTLDKQNHDIYFITDRPGIATKHQTTMWLMQNGYTGIPSVIVSGRKGLIAQGLRLDTIIDDKVENCVDVSNAMGASCRVFMLNRSWNKSFTDLRYIERTNSIKAMLEDIGL